MGGKEMVENIDLHYFVQLSILAAIGRAACFIFT